MRKLLPAFLWLILALIFPFKIAFAAAGNITVAPAILQLDLDKDSPQADISYTNNTQSPITITFKAQDFSSLTDGWQVKFLQPEDSKNYSFSLSSWLKFEQSELEVNPGETQTIKVDINKDELSSGTHYAAIIGLVKSSALGNVSVVSALSTLLFVSSKNGYDIVDGRVDSLVPVRSFLETPDRFTLGFKNSGNITLTPYGLLSVYDPFGHQISKAVLNQESLITLPESIRQYNLTANDLDEGRFHFPGQYSDVITIHFGPDSRYQTFASYFWSMGDLNFTESLVTAIIILILIAAVKKIRSVPR